MKSASMKSESCTLLSTMRLRINSYTVTPLYQYYSYSSFHKRIYVIVQIHKMIFFVQTALHAKTFVDKRTVLML